MGRRLRHLPALDGLRGIAILLVFGNHCFGEPQGGPFGVDLFFLLSGFLITSLLLEELETQGRISARAFYRRRAARLLPALFVMLAAYLTIDAAKGANGLERAAIAAFYLTNIVGSFGPQHGVMFNSGLDHLWSLAQEEQFYLVWPFVLPLVATARKPIRVLTVVIGVMVVWRIGLALLTGAPHNRLYGGPDTHSDGLVAGAAVAFLLLRRPDFRIKPLWVALASGVAIDVILVRPMASGWDAFALPFVEAAGLGLLLAALTIPVWQRAFSAAPLRWFGRISYSLYLWHYMLVWAWGYPRHAWAAAALAIVIAFISTRWLEEPLRARLRGHARPSTVLTDARANPSIVLTFDG